MRQRDQERHCHAGTDGHQEPWPGPIDDIPDPQTGDTGAEECERERPRHRRAGPAEIRLDRFEEDREAVIENAPGGDLPHRDEYQHDPAIVDAAHTAQSPADLSHRPTPSQWTPVAGFRAVLYHQGTKEHQEHQERNTAHSLVPLVLLRVPSGQIGGSFPLRFNLLDTTFLLSENRENSKEGCLQ